MNYIVSYNNALIPELCEHIIEKFEASSKKHERTVLEGHRSFTELNISAEKQWHDINEMLLDKMQDYLKRYMRDFEIDNDTWPKQIGYEQLRVKRYLPNDVDRFDFHVDVGDYSSARRFLVYFFYLNTVDEGGETCFTLNKKTPPHIKVKPEEGKLLMFPPLWTHPHIAMKPISGPKYIIGGYLHYV